MKIRDLILWAGMTFSAVFGSNCKDDVVPPAEPPRTYQETERLREGDWFVVGSAPFARALEFEDADLANYRLAFREKGGYSREISVAPVIGTDNYLGKLVCDGVIHPVEYCGGRLRVDSNGDMVFEDRDTLVNLVSRTESKVVRPGQSFLYRDAQGEACVSYLGHSTDRAFFRDQQYGTREVTVAPRTDGALGGMIVLDGHAYPFALNADGSVVMDRNEDAKLEGFVANGLPAYFYADSRALSEGVGDDIVLGTMQYYVEPFLIDAVNKTARFVVNGEVTPPIAEGASYQLHARPGQLQLHEVVPAVGTYPSKVSFALRAD